MREFTPASYKVLIVEDCPEWRRKLRDMYCRILYGRLQDCPNIFLASTAEDAVKLITERSPDFNLISLDINLGSRASLGINGSESTIAVTGLDVFDKMQTLQRGASVVVITEASSDSELPQAFLEGDQDGIARAKITLSSDLQTQFQGAHRFFVEIATCPVGHRDTNLEH